MARPKKAEADRRNRTVKVRFNGVEFDEICQRAVAAGKSFADYVRGITVNAPPTRKPVTPARAINLNGLAELGRIGSNLNQLQREINTRAKYPELGEIKPDLVNQALEEVAILSRMLIDELDNGNPGSNAG